MLIALYVLLALVVAVFVFIIVLAWKVSGMIVHPRVYAYDTVVDEEIKREHFTRKWFDANVRLEEFTLPSAFGYPLHCVNHLLLLAFQLEFVWQMLPFASSAHSEMLAKWLHAYFTRFHHVNNVPFGVTFLLFV